MLFLCLSLIDAYDEQVILEALYNKYSDPMFQAAYAIVHNQYDAEDAVHNAFVAIVDKLTVVDSLEPVQQKAYVCRAARNCAINIWTKQNREKHYIILAARESCFASEYDDVLEQICNEENVKRVVQCILSLPDIYRDVLHLYYVEDMKPRRIARKLRLKDATVRQRLHRGKQMLLEKLTGLEENTREKEKRNVATCLY